MANYWAGQGQNVTILTFDYEEKPFHPLHPAINRKSLRMTKESLHFVLGFFRNLHRIWVLRRALWKSRPQIVISFVDKTNILTLCASRGLSLPVIVSERTNPAAYSVGRVWSWLRRISYPWADAVVCQTRSALIYFNSVKLKRRVVIPNPLLPPPGGNEERSENMQSGKKYSVIAMGRFVEEKGFDLLLKAFSMLSDQHRDWSLRIVGDGPLRKHFHEQVEILGLSGRVQFPGTVSDPYMELSRADIFVLSSRFEGFPNALCEAMACGLPVISFDCPSGPRAIIRDGVDGILVPPESVQALASALDRLMGNEAEREQLARRAPEVLDRFGVEKIMAMWDELIEATRNADSVRGN